MKGGWRVSLGKNFAAIFRPSQMRANAAFHPSPFRQTYNNRTIILLEVLIIESSPLTS